MTDSGFEETDARVTHAIDWLVAHWADQPRLEAAAAVAGMEPTRFQKIFQNRVGLSPKRFVQALTHRHVRDILAGGHVSTLAAAYEAGLSGNGRLHDLFVTVEAATPGEVRAKGRGMTVVYGVSDSPFGELIAARTPRGLCYLGFRVDDSRDACLDRMRAQWPQATFVHDNTAVAADCALVCRIIDGQARAGGDMLRLHLFGTNFQMQVWRALLKIPVGAFVSYQAIGAGIGVPDGARAVGGAVGANPVSLLIPCHRVIRRDGVLDNYGWGSARKKALLAVEAGSCGLLPQP